jgi:sarcosine oxidase, subunit beta
VAMVQHYSIFSLIRNTAKYHENWPRSWRSPEPKSAHDVIIVGGGGHGLATAHYLAREHGITNIAVLEKGWVGGGNTRAEHSHDSFKLSARSVSTAPRSGCSKI